MTKAEAINHAARLLLMAEDGSERESERLNRVGNSWIRLVETMNWAEEDARDAG